MKFSILLFLVFSFCSAAERNFAKIVDSKVSIIIVANDINWCIDNLGGTWVECTGQSAGICYTYINGKFIPPQPYASWTWDGTKWNAPVATPIDAATVLYVWDETNKVWKKFQSK